MKIQRYATLLAVLVFPVAVSSTQVPTSTRGVPAAWDSTGKRRYEHIHCSGAGCSHAAGHSDSESHHHP